MHIPSATKRWIRAWFTDADSDGLLDVPTGTPASTDLIPYVAVTAAVSEIRRGTATAAGTATKTITFKNAAGATLLTGTVGAGITAGASGTAFATNIVAWLNTGSNLTDAGLSAVTDNLNGTFDLTWPAGGSPGSVVTTDTHLSFAETQAGAAEIDVLMKGLVGSLGGGTDLSGDFEIGGSDTVIKTDATAQTVQIGDVNATNNGTVLTVDDNEGYAECQGFTAPVYYLSGGAGSRQIGVSSDRIQLLANGGAKPGLDLQGPLLPGAIADADAPNSSMYFSSDASKLVWKDAGGVVHALY